MAPAVVRRWRVIMGVAVVAGWTVVVTATPLGSAITYQGVLTDDGSPATGTFDVRFRLYDASSGGTLLATTTANDRVVVDGVVSAVLDFGDHWEGSARWLEVGVRDGASTGAYTVITPRQPLRPAPQAWHATDADHASTADHATIAGNSNTLDTRHGSYLLNWSNRTGVPTDLADGDDDTLADLACSAGEVPSWNGSAWGCAADRVGTMTTTVVGPVGSPTANGAALLAAVAALPAPTSAADSVTLHLEPGTYDLGAAAIVLPPWTVLAGAGEGLTVLTSTVCSPLSGGAATLRLDESCEVRDLTVENTCAVASDAAIAIWLSGLADAARLTRVTAHAAGTVTGAVGILNEAAEAFFTRVTASASGGSLANTGISSGDDAVFVDCGATGTGGTIASGLLLANDPTPGNPRSVVQRGTFSASGATTSYGLYIISAGADLAQVNLTGSSLGMMIFNDDGINDVFARRLTSNGGLGVRRDSGGLSVSIEQSRVLASGPTVDVVGTAVVGVAATQLWGAAADPAVTCTAVWDESWVFYPAACP